MAVQFSFLTYMFKKQISRDFVIAVNPRDHGLTLLEQCVNKCASGLPDTIVLIQSARPLSLSGSKRVTGPDCSANRTGFV